ncbi:hypothetical protein MASR1M68_11330 [Elusimicrobiota bacterium]
MADIKNQINLYFQRLLKLQFDLSKDITHQLTKGEIRENFIKNIIKSDFPALNITRGILHKGKWQSKQADFILLSPSANMGTINLYNLDDALMFMEIKSCAKSSEFKKLNKTAQNIKSRCLEGHKILVGIFCYSTKLQQQTVCKNFGLNYDNEIKGYDKYNKNLDKYKNIDFCLCLNCKDEDDTVYYIMRDISKNCTLYIKNPVIEFFLNNFKKYFD